MPSYQVLEQYVPSLPISLDELKVLVVAGAASEAEKIKCDEFDLVVA